MFQPFAGQQQQQQLSLTVRPAADPTGSIVAELFIVPGPESHTVTESGVDCGHYR
jgi:hypothetical protein